MQEENDVGSLLEQNWEGAAPVCSRIFLLLKFGIRFSLCWQSAGFADVRGFCLEINERRLALWHFGSHTKVKNSLWPAKGLCATEDALLNQGSNYFSSYIFSPIFTNTKKKKIKWSSAVFQSNYITPASLLCWQIMHFIYQVRASMCPCVAYYSKLRTNCLTYSTSTNSTSVLCGWAGRAIIIYSHSGGNYSARLSVWSGDLRCILSSLKLKATGFNFWPSQKSLDGSMK